MATTAGVAYVVAATLLFFFWFYGIVTFYFHLRYRYIPFVTERIRRRHDAKHLL